MTTTTERGSASRTTIAPQRAAARAAAAPKRIKLPREQDPRNPKLRLQALLDAGSVELITADDDSGMLAATGTDQRLPGGRLLLRRHRDGRRDGHGRLRRGGAGL